MDEEHPQALTELPFVAEASVARSGLAWLKEGARVVVFRPPRWTGLEAGPLAVAMLVLAAYPLALLVQWALMEGSPHFLWNGVLSGWLGVAVWAWLCWTVARSSKLAVDTWPLRTEPVTPDLLKRWLDAAGVRWRVISVSACYSGSWIEPLAGDGTLVMTAADATHTSYGCGKHSELTFFGRAMYEEALRKTWSFTEAHAAPASSSK